MFEIFEKNFNNEEKIILDGVPRNGNQAKWIRNFFIKKNYKIIFINMIVSKENLIKRILDRKRQDDKLEIFEKRYKIYQNNLKGIINSLEEHKKDLDSNGSIEKINIDIKTFLLLILISSLFFNKI